MYQFVNQFGDTQEANEEQLLLLFVIIEINRETLVQKTDTQNDNTFYQLYNIPILKKKV